METQIKEKNALEIIQSMSECERILLTELISDEMVESFKKTIELREKIEG